MSVHTSSSWKNASLKWSFLKAKLVRPVYPMGKMYRVSKMLAPLMKWISLVSLWSGKRISDFFFLNGESLPLNR